MALRWMTQMAAQKMMEKNGKSFQKKTLRISSNKGQTGDMVLRKFGTAETCWLALLELDTSIENILMALQKNFGGGMAL